MKRYEYATGNIELAMRVKAGEPLPAVLAEVKARWTPGNESLWDEFDIESLLDTEEKRGYTVNTLLYCRLSIYRALRDAGRDVRGQDPVQFVGEVPETMRALQARFRQVFRKGAAAAQRPSGGTSATSGTRVLGGIVFVAGIALLIGNVTGAFPTFPFAGYITMAIGGALLRAGS